MYITVDASNLIKLGHIRIKSEYDPDYPGQWVIQVSDADPVLTLNYVDTPVFQ